MAAFDISVCNCLQLRQKEDKNRFFEISIRIKITGYINSSI